MKKFFFASLFILAAPAAASGHSELGLEKRQPDTAKNATSVVLVTCPPKSGPF